jgi:protocatechuate 3,4-dioxygenase, beta subunit
MQISRRNLIAQLIGTAAATAGMRSIAAVCSVTPAQGQGPFYPERDRNRDNDLRRFRKDPALGESITLEGQVTGEDCRPVEGAVVEIWQAAASGRYNHSGDRNQLKLDPNFQYWGQFKTGSDGRYRFLTIIPGHYPLDPNLVGQKPSGPGQFRPPHIHLKVRAPGLLSLTTQVYFDPKSYDEAGASKTVSDLNRWENVDPRLTVLYQPDLNGEKTGQFDIVLRA